MAVILDGKELAKKKREELKEKILKLKEKRGIIPGLAIVRVGNNSASETYVHNKLKACQEVGISALEKHFLGMESEEEIISAIEQYNQDENIDGIIVQSPLPNNYNENYVASKVLGAKDADGFGIENLGYLLSNQEHVLAATPKGILNLLDAYQIPLEGKHVVIVGRSVIVGRPMAIMCLNRHATVTMCHSKTDNLAKYTKEADILISAVGKPYFIDDEMVKDGAVLIDVGMNRVDGKWFGDITPRAQEKASFYTPVPGGVGPMTVVTLLENVYELSLKRERKDR